MNDNANRSPDDDQTGYDHAPDRYMAKGRETIDRQRDQCRAEARRVFTDPGFAEMTGDWAFSLHCRATALKYMDRRGLKEGEPEARCIRKAEWYLQMADHVMGVPCGDPRANQVDFTPYVEQEFTGREEGLNGV